MFSRFTEEAQKVLVNAKKEMMELKHPYVGSEHLVLSILKNKNLNVTKQLEESGLTYQKMKDEIISVVGIGSEDNTWFLYTPLLKRILENAILEAKENRDGEVTVEHLFISLLEEGEGVAIRILLGMGIDLDEVYLSFSNGIKKKGKPQKKLMVLDFGTDFNERVRKGDIDPVVGRKEEITRILEILCRRSKNNPLLIGEAGVGKTAIVEELSRLIVNGKVPEKLRGKRIISMSIAGLVAGTKYRGEFEERVNKILKEVEDNPDIILFVDEIHTLVGAGGAEGAIDASNILKPVLARGKIRLIGATTTEEYKKFIERDKAFARRFQTVLVEEPNEDETLSILKELKPFYEGYHHVEISDSILEYIVLLSNRYLFDRKQPDKALDLLDEVCAKVSLKPDQGFDKLEQIKQSLSYIVEEKNKAIMKQDFKRASFLKEEEHKLEDKKNRLELKLSIPRPPRVVTKEEVLLLTSKRTKIPVYEGDFNFKKEILTLENELNQEVLGQKEVIHSLCFEVKAKQLGLREGIRPDSFLFVGKTGVGKTKLVKEFASRMVGKEHFIRLDMSEYRENHSISKIIGSPPGYVGYKDHHSVLEQVRTYPYSILLLDEIEKAHPEVIQLFLQAMDEGIMKMSNGNVVRFDHVMIFMTSNIGCNTDTIGFHEGKKSSIISKLKEVLSIEFINRIGHIFVFEGIDRETSLKIIDQELKKVKKLFLDKGIKIDYDKGIKEEIFNLSETSTFGARKISQVIHQKIDSYIIEEVLEGRNHIRVKSVT